MSAKKQIGIDKKKGIVKPVKVIHKPVINERIAPYGCDDDGGIAPCDETNTVVVPTDAERLVELISKLENDKNSFYNITIGYKKVHLERNSKFDPFINFNTSLLGALKCMENNDLEC